MYISPFTTSRTFTVRLLPPRLPGRMSGSTWLHSASVKSLGYRSLLRSYRARFSIVHIGDLSTTQAATLASQTLDPIQYVPEQALRGVDGTSWVGIFAPHGTPPALAVRINSEINRILGQPEVREQLLSRGADLMPMSVDDFSRFVRAERKKYADLTKEA